MDKKKTAARKGASNVNLIHLICIIVTAGCIFAAVTIYITRRDSNAFVYEKNYDKVLIEFDDVNITLKDAAYYIMIMEAESDRVAKAYNSNDPLAYWGVMLGGDKTVRAYVKSTVLGLIIRDSMYYLEGAALGLVPDESRVKEINNNVNTILKSMTSQQMEFTNFTYSELYAILYRIDVAKLYISHVTSENKTLVEDDFNEGGSHYKDIYKKYTDNKKIKINEDLWSKITLGKLSINRQQN